MDEGTKLEETMIRARDILRNRYWIINIIWSIVWIIIIWNILYSGFFLSLFNIPGIIFFLIGLGCSLIIQIRYSVGWPNRLPLFVPKPFGQTKATRNAIIAILIWAPIFSVITWIRMINPWFHSIYVSIAVALLAFIVGALISGSWLSLVGLIWIENREGIRVVKQGDKFIALTLEEVYPPKPGNT